MLRYEGAAVANVNVVVNWLEELKTKLPAK